uniref:Uncharacterized protein LOC114348525 n=1 Tax=Diabrotica virgifera virgifera TaxID=50390 RepID=A0A6P7GYR2_DIAVI
MIDDEDFAELVVLVNRATRHFRGRVDHFQKWIDEEFRNRFRMSKPVVRYVLNKISHSITSRTFRNHALSPAQMLFATLRFLATGSMLYVIGDLNGIDKATSSRVITR